jgi:hypothetical protein
MIRRCLPVGFTALPPASSAPEETVARVVSTTWGRIKNARR